MDAILKSAAERENGMKTLAAPFLYFGLTIHFLNCIIQE